MLEWPKILSNQQDYLKEIFDEWYPYLYRAILRYYGNTPINPTTKVAEIFERALHNFMGCCKGNPEPAFFQKALLLEIIADLKADSSSYYISSTYNPKTPHKDTNNLFDPYSPADYQSLRPEQILRALAALPPPKRLVYNLHELDGYSLEDISAMLETSLQTVKMNLEKARYEFQKYLENDVQMLTNDEKRI